MKNQKQKLKEEKAPGVDVGEVFKILRISCISIEGSSVVRAISNDEKISECDDK